MSNKQMSFWTYCWFASTLICMVLEGSFWGAHNTSSIVSGLTVFTSYNVAGLFSIPVINIDFWPSVIRMLLWDYSFYTGWYEIFRWIFLVVLSPGLAFGLYQVTVWLYGQIMSLFKLI